MAVSEGRVLPVLRRSPAGQRGRLSVRFLPGKAEGKTDTRRGVQSLPVARIARQALRFLRVTHDEAH